MKRVTFLFNSTGLDKNTKSCSIESTVDTRYWSRIPKLDQGQIENTNEVISKMMLIAEKRFPSPSRQSLLA